MAALKALVIGMGVLIVAGFVVLIYGVLTKAGGPTGSAVENRITLPAGATVQSMQMGGDLIVLHVKDRQGREHLLSLDARKGRIVSSLELVSGEQP